MVLVYSQSCTALWWIEWWIPQKVSPAGICKCDLKITVKLVADIVKDLEVNSSWIIINPMTSVLTSKHKGREAQRSDVKMEAEIGVVYVSTSQGMPRIARSHPKRGENHWTDAPSEPPQNELTLVTS